MPRSPDADPVDPRLGTVAQRSSRVTVPPRGANRRDPVGAPNQPALHRPLIAERIENSIATCCSLHIARAMCSSSVPSRPYATPRSGPCTALTPASGVALLLSSWAGASRASSRCWQLGAERALGDPLSGSARANGPDEPESEQRRADDDRTTSGTATCARVQGRISRPFWAAGHGRGIADQEFT
jgi:hypothetical protein